MRPHLKRSFVFVIALIFTLSCTGTKDKNADRIIIGLESDVQTLNPLFAMSASESDITELIYLSIVGHGWDDQTGFVTTSPVLAKSIEWNNDSTSVLVTIRDDAKWSDGVNVTADDVVFSFDLYSDAKVQSRFFGTFKHYYTKPDLSIDLAKTFQVISPSQIRINFTASGRASYFDFDLPIMPKHLFEKLDRSGLATSDMSFKPVGSGPYKLESWEKSQNLKLVKNENSFLSSGDEIKEIVFKIIPDYNSRINQLKKGEIDLTENIRPEDIESLSSEKDLSIVPRKGREYDYLGLNNIEPAQQKGKKIVPNNLFGSPSIRKAIAYALNRQTIIDEYLMGHGELMVGPIAPIYKSDLDPTLKPMEFNIDEAKKILKSEGWNDSDGDGILDKNGRKFSFTISVPSGNPLRTFTSNIVQNNLKAVGIDAKIEFLEPAVIFPKMFKGELNAWVAGWGVPIPLNLKPYWYSDKKIAGANVCNFRNPEIDKILEKLETKITDTERHELLKRFQKIVSDEQPVVFLFWIDNMVGFNNRIKNIPINPLGVVQKCWTWSINK
ncbi:MAG: ABC transporter substrate-binding protein [Ignavibacteriales bacterium]|nr:ABC transporter substrate-binding protein [Ignavibacteriales bacterium]